MEKVFEIYIRTTPERLWEAMTDADIRGKYQFGNRVSSDWTPGSRLEMSNPKAPGLLGEGVNIEVDPRAGSSRPWLRSGATTLRAREPPGSPGKSNRSATPAA